MSGNGKKISVHSYVRKDGTAVGGYQRRGSTPRQPSTRGAKSTSVVGSGFRKVAGHQIPLIGSRGKFAPIRFTRVPYHSDLSGLDLRGADFSNLKISDVDFSGSDLRGAIFDGSKMSQVDFSGAIISESSFVDTLATHVKADRLHVEDCTFMKARLFFDRSLPKPVVTGISDALMDGANIGWVDLSGQDLTGLDYTSSSGENKWVEADFRDSNLSGVTLYRAHFSSCDFTGADFTKADLRGTYWHDSVAVSAKFEEANLSWASFYDGNMRNSYFGGSRFSIAIGQRVDWSNCDFSNATMVNEFAAQVVSCNFAGSDFSGADLGETRFSSRTYAESEKAKMADPSVLSHINWLGTKTRLIDIGENLTDGSPPVSFEQYDFHSAADLLNLNSNQFQFLVVSGSVEVRDRKTNKIVKAGFDVGKHYIPVWSVQNIQANLEIMGWKGIYGE